MADRDDEATTSACWTFTMTQIEEVLVQSQLQLQAGLYSLPSDYDTHAFQLVIFIAPFIHKNTSAYEESGINYIYRLNIIFKPKVVKNIDN